jgi:serine/threonine protein kinase
LLTMAVVSWQPGNFVAVGSTLKLIDFGTAVMLEDAEAGRPSENQITCPAYMAPEVLQGETDNRFGRDAYGPEINLI